jgi:hypothetical protein
MKIYEIVLICDVCCDVTSQQTSQIVSQVRLIIMNGIMVLGSRNILVKCYGKCKKQYLSDTDF